jgi:hypothetical protein
VPRKPKPTRGTRTGARVENPRATAGIGVSARTDASHKTPRTKLTGVLQLGNSDVVAWCNEQWLIDIEAKNPTEGRYSRIRSAAMAHFGCSRSTAERSLRDAELQRAAEAEGRRPQLRARAEEQLQRIADREEERDPRAAVAALREISRIGGLYAPQRLEVTMPNAGPLFDIRAVMGALSARGRAALDIVLEDLAEAQAAGRLLPAGADEDATPPDDGIEDAELVDPLTGSEPEPN